MKLVYLLWSTRARSTAQLRADLLDVCAPQILTCKIAQLQINIADDLADCPSPAPKVPLDDPVRAQLNVWVHDVEDRIAVDDILRHQQFQLACYRVRESIYSDYGDNRHSASRSWPDGVRSPGVLALTLLKKPKRLAYDDWMQRWHGRQSPLSEAMQPRTRYVRNVVLTSLTPGAPAYDGFVEECWPSFRHVTNKFLFFGASNIFSQAYNLFRMLRSVTSFLNLSQIRTYMMSEYFIKSDQHPNRLQRIHG